MAGVCRGYGFCDVVLYRDQRGDGAGVEFRVLRKQMPRDEYGISKLTVSIVIYRQRKNILHIWQLRHTQAEKTSISTTSAMNMTLKNSVY